MLKLPNSEPNNSGTLTSHSYGVSGSSISKIAETMNAKWVFVFHDFPCRVHSIMQMSNNFLSHIRDNEQRRYDFSSAETSRHVCTDANRKSECVSVHRQPPTTSYH